MRDPGLSAAIQAVGGVSELARRVGISQPSVSNWDKVPAERVVAVEAATGIPRVRLRPDLYREQPAADVDEVDLARAQEYALLSTLLARAPDADLLAGLARLGGDASPLGVAHVALAEAAAQADPAIRDFVGLSENAWDFTDPNAMPGFGPLESTDEIRRMIARVVDQIGEAARAETAEVQESARDSNALSASEQNNESAKQSASTPALPRENAAADSGNKVMLQSSKEDDAVQREIPEDQLKRKQFSQRTHGSALPR